MFDLKVFNSKPGFDIYNMNFRVRNQLHDCKCVFYVYDTNGRFVIKIYDIHHEFIHDINDIKMNFFVYIYNRNGNFTT